MEKIDAIIPDEETQREHAGITRRIKRDLRLAEPEAKALAWVTLMQEDCQKPFPVGWSEG